MELTTECRTLLGDLYGSREKDALSFPKGKLKPPCIRMLQDLEKRKIIKNLSLDPDISFEMINWSGLDEYGIASLKDLVTEPYGFEKQCRVVKEVITKKAQELDNPKYAIDSSDFILHGGDHIQIFEVIKALKKEKFLKAHSFWFTPDGEFEIKIELLGDYHPPQKKEESKPPVKIKAECTRKFHFKDGVLFRDHVDAVLIFKNENSLQYKLLNSAFSLPVDERLDGLTDGLDMSGRQIPDTAGEINKKIQDAFGVSGFFETDYPNKSAKRIVE